MKLIPFYGKAWESNSYLLINGERAILIDAGVPHEEVTEHLEREGAKLQYILLTHGHFDHIISAERLREQTAAQLAIHKADAEMHEARGAGRKTRYLGALRENAGRILCLNVRGGFSDMGE